jgi:hypothetical protein
LHPRRRGLSGLTDCPAMAAVISGLRSAHVKK